MNDVLVLRNGISLMGHSDCLPSIVTNHLRSSCNVKTLLEKVHAQDPTLLERLQGRLYYYSDGEELELKHMVTPSEWKRQKRKERKSRTSTSTSTNQAANANANANADANDSGANGKANSKHEENTNDENGDNSDVEDDDNDDDDDELGEQPVLKTLKQKLQAMRTRSDVPADVYLAELRFCEKYVGLWLWL